MRQGSGRTGAVVDDNPRPTTHSEPLMKSSTSEDDLSNRNSTASTSFSDRSSFTPTETSSPFAMSPWNTTNSPWSQSSDTSLFPPGTGLVGSLVREEGHIYSLAAASSLLYTGSDSKNIRVWKNQREFSGFKATSGLVKAIVVSPFDRRVFTGHQDGKIRVWRPSPKSPAVHKRIGTLPRLKDLIKNLGRRRNPSNSIRHSDAVSCLSLSDDGSIIYSGSWDRTIKVWRVADSRCVESIMAHDDAVNCIVVVEGLMLSGSADGTVKAWRREAGTARHTGVQTLLKQESAVTAMAAMKRAGVVYCGSSDGAINFWEQLGHRGVLKGHEGAVMCLAAAGEGMLFSGGVDRTIRVWRRDAGSGAHACASVMTGHAGPVKCLAVAAEAGVWVVYSGSLDKSVKVWKVADPDATDGDRSTTPPVAYHGAPRFDNY